MSETTFTRDDGGMTDRYLVVRQSNGQVVFDTDDFSEAQQVKNDCEDVDEQNSYCIADTRITPPTPDLDAVVARVRQNLCEMTLRCDWGDHTIDPSDLRALLAAVSRPAEARGEPTDAETSKCRAFIVHGVPCRQETAVGSDAYCQHHLDSPAAAPRPEAGEPSEAMVEAIESLPTCEIRSEADEYHGRDGSLYVSLEDVLAVIRAAQREPKP